EAPWLHVCRELRRGQQWDDRFGKPGGIHRRLVGVPDTESPADIVYPKRGDVYLTQPGDQLEQPSDPFAEGSLVDQLTPQVHGQGCELEPWSIPDKLGGGNHLVDRNSELDAALAGRDVGMGLGGDIRVDPDADRYSPALGRRQLCQQLQLFARLDVDVAKAGADRLLQL